MIGAIAAMWVMAFMYATSSAQQPPEKAPTQPPAGSRSIWDGVYTEAQAKRGETVYKDECVRCHGESLMGNGEGVGPLTGIGFMALWNGLTLGDLFDRMRISMPQDKPGKLTRQQNADVIAYMLSFNRFPAGKSELPVQSERLKQIQFEAFKK